MMFLRVLVHNHVCMFIFFIFILFILFILFIYLFSYMCVWVTYGDMCVYLYMCIFDSFIFL